MTKSYSLFRLGRYHRLIGAYLLFFPALWGLILGGQGQLFFDKILLFAIGAIVVRGAGCTYNDWIDKNIDRQVQRTQTRPLAAKQLSSREVFIFLFAQLSIGAVILVQLNTRTQLLGIIAVLLIGLYPWMKRITGWPQLFLGLTYNWGMFMGFTAVNDQPFSMKVWYLFLAGWLWTFFYDTIYAHQDQIDDKLLGVGSAAVSLGQYTKIVLWGVILLIGFLLSLVLEIEFYRSFYIVAIALGHLIWQIYTVNLIDPANCMKIFDSNKWLGWWISAGLIICYR